jgi:malonyl-CoA decarboxylase
MNSAFFGDLLQSIAERGRALLERRARRPVGEARAQTLTELCETLLSRPGEASGMAIAAEVLAAYARLKTGERIAFFESLAHRFGPDHERLQRAAAAYQRDPGDARAAELHDAAEARRQELIRRLNRAPGGTAALVEMREHLLDALARRPELAPVDRDFFHLFASWFNRGFLVLRRIDWSTPANILEKIIRYEAVHQIRDWDDLRSRIDVPDRRCYAFFHPALVDEPLIFVEVALTVGMPDAIAPILERDRAPLDASEATTSVFYSISNCHRGLNGVSFGAFLIKQVVEEISRELPDLSDFVTLSPLPGLVDWLRRERAAPDSPTILDSDRAALAELDAPAWPQSSEAAERLSPVLGALAAHYLLLAKGSSGRPLDPVARFHLGNGARLERIHLMADPSPRGLAQSAGVMVNYRYVLADIEKNHEAYESAGEVVASPLVRRLLRSEAPQPSLVPQA